MHEIDATNVVAYLISRGSLTPDEPASAAALAGGVSNVVLRIDTPQRSLVVKQARRQLRVPDPWFSRLDRVLREADVMRSLAQLLPPPTVPEVLFEDRENFLFGMTAAPREHEVWKARLLQGLRADDVAVARRSGEILGTIHAHSRGRADWARQFADREVFWQLRLEPFYLRLAQKHPDAQPAIAALIDEQTQTALTLVHADFSPKNILVHAQGLTLVDYETAHWGDPAFDLGFFLSHLVLKAFKHVPQHHGFFDLTQAFWESYLAEMSRPPAAEPPSDPLAPQPLVRRTLLNFAACAWARIDATSRIDYLPEPEKRDAVRRLCRRLLLEPVAQWSDALALANALLRV